MTLQFETTSFLNRGSSSSGTFNAAGQPMKKYGKLVLVDLAGSERLKVISYLHVSYLPGGGGIGRGGCGGGERGVGGNQ